VRTAGPGGTTVTPKTETFKTPQLMQQRLAQLQNLAKDIKSGIADVNSLTDPGTPGQSVGYLRNQAVNYGVNLILQSAPWLPRGAATRMAQQLVAGVFGNQPQPKPQYGPPAPPGTTTTP
jgi:hypothetical protein